MAFDAALALEAEGQQKDAEEAYMTTSKRVQRGAFEAIAARVRLAELYRAEGRKDEAAALDAIVDKVWANADPGLREAVRRMK